MRKAMIALFVLAVLFVAACRETPQPGGNTYLGGSKGVTLSFYPGSPPEQAADNNQEEFDIIVELINEGEHLIKKEDAFVKLSGFPPELFGTTLADLKKQPLEDLEGRTRNADGTIIEPIPSSAEFLRLKYRDTVPGNVQFPIRAEVCYEYHTNAAGELCVKEQMNIDEDDDFCKVTGSRSLSVSGAPIQVANLRQSLAGKDKTRFVFQVSNAGNGRVFKTGSDCAEDRVNDNKVWVEVKNLVGRGAGDTLRCSGLRDGDETKGYITLPEDGTALEISCLLTITQRNDRMQPFSVNLTYDYSEALQKSIEIVHNE